MDEHLKEAFDAFNQSLRELESAVNEYYAAYQSDIESMNKNCAILVEVL